MSLKIEQNKLTINVDLNIYNQETITSTVHKFTDRCYVSQKRIDNIISISFQMKFDSIVNWTLLEKEFENELIEQQVRFDIEQKFGYIRDRMVEKAFSPIS